MRQRDAIGHDERHCLFETALGVCGVAWSIHGLTRLQLPESDREATARRLRERTGRPRAATPTDGVAEVIAAVQRYMAGEPVDFAGVWPDLTGVSDFHRRIYGVLRTVAWGQTTTYGELARRAGASDAARAIGHAMGRNPLPIIIPCHRVLASGRKIGGFSAFGGPVAKERLLALEGVHLGDELPLLRLLRTPADGSG